jgi:serine/threonine-protein kinase
VSELVLPPSLSPAEVRLLDEICDRFEAAWKAGQRPRLEEYLGPVAEPLRACLLGQLLPLDWEYRLRAGDRPQAAEYEARFPGAAPLIEAVGREVTAAADTQPIPGTGAPAAATAAVGST